MDCSSCGNGSKRHVEQCEGSLLPRINRARTSVSNALFETPEANSTLHRLRTASISIVTHSRLAQGPHTAPLRPTQNRRAARCPPAARGAKWCRQPKTRAMRWRTSPRAAARPRAVPARRRSRHAAPRPRRRPKHARRVRSTLPLTPPPRRHTLHPSCLAKEKAAAARASPSPAARRRRRPRPASSSRWRA